MLVQYMEDLFGSGIMDTEFGIALAGILVVASATLIFKTVLGWFKEIF